MTWFFDTFNYRQPVPVIAAERGESFVIGSGDQPGPQGLPYLMEITITQDAGTTRVRLVNSGFSPDANFDEEFEGVVSGWKMALATLKQWLEHYDGAKRHHTLVIEPAAYTWSSLLPLFRTPEGRRQWLEPVLRADAEVLADTGREVLLAWRERSAVVGLKAFRMGPQTAVALDMSAWTGTPDDQQQIRSALAAALSRLKTQLG